MCPKHWDLCDQAAIFKEPVLGGNNNNNNNNKYKKSFKKRTVDAEKMWLFAEFLGQLVVIPPARILKRRHLIFTTDSLEGKLRDDGIRNRDK